MMDLLPVPIVMVNQDIPRLAEAAVDQLLRQTRWRLGHPLDQPVVLPATRVTNIAFDRLVQQRNAK